MIGADAVLAGREVYSRKVKKIFLLNIRLVILFWYNRCWSLISASLLLMNLSALVSTRFVRILYIMDSWMTVFDAALKTFKKSFL